MVWVSETTAISIFINSRLRQKQGRLVGCSCQWLHEWYRQCNLSRMPRRIWLAKAQSLLRLWCGGVIRNTCWNRQGASGALGGSWSKANEICRYIGLEYIYRILDRAYAAMPLTVSMIARFRHFNQLQPRLKYTENWCFKWVLINAYAVHDLPYLEVVGANSG